MDWLRWYVGTVNDPKWRVVARRAGVPVHAVVAVWAAMLEHAAEDGRRGTLERWDAEAVAAALDLEPAQVEAVRQAMHGRTLDGDEVSAWNRRQPRREREDPSTERVREHRARQKGVTEDAGTRVTPCNATKRHETPRGEESRVEESTTPPVSPPSGGTATDQDRRKRATQLPSSWQPSDSHRALAHELGVNEGAETEKFRDYHTAKGSAFRDWDAAFRNWLRNAPGFGGGKAGRNGKPPTSPHELSDEEFLAKTLAELR